MGICELNYEILEVWKRFFEELAKKSVVEHGFEEISKYKLEFRSIKTHF